MADRNPLTLRLAGTLLAAAGLLSIVGCADQAARRDGELQELLALLPGHYDNIAQVRAEAAQGLPQREALLLAIVPVYAPLIGDHVFYLQEAVASDARRVTAQQLFTLQVANGDPLLIETQMALAEPNRWRDGDRNPDLFKSLLPTDVRTLGGCELTWSKLPGGFDAASDPARCRASSRVTGEALRVALTLQLRADSLQIAERRTDATGVVVQGGADDPGYRFQRRAD